MGVGEAQPAAGEGAAAVPGFQGPAQGGRNRAGLPAHIQHGAARRLVLARRPQVEPGPEGQPVGAAPVPRRLPPPHPVEPGDPPQQAARGGVDVGREGGDLFSQRSPAPPAPALRERAVLTSSQLARGRSGTEVAVAGLVICRQRPGTAKGGAAKGGMFVTPEEETGFANFVVMPDVQERYRTALLR